jgi:hypothetical protein
VFSSKRITFIGIDLAPETLRSYKHDSQPSELLRTFARLE